MHPPGKTAAPRSSGALLSAAKAAHTTVNTLKEATGGVNPQSPPPIFSHYEERIAQLEHELASERELNARLIAIIQAASAKPIDRVGAAALLIQAERRPKEGGYVPVDDYATAEAFGTLIGVSRNTAGDVLRRLESAGIVERHVDRQAVNRMGEAIPASALNPRNGDHWIATSAMAIFPRDAESLAQMMAATAETVTERRRQDAQRAERTRDLAKIGKQLLETPCPHCGTIGVWHVTCGACGSTWMAQGLVEEGATEMAESAAPMETPDPTDRRDEILNRKCQLRALRGVHTPPPPPMDFDQYHDEGMTIQMAARIGNPESGRPRTVRTWAIHAPTAQKLTRRRALSLAPLPQCPPTSLTDPRRTRCRPTG
jgi:hypothetical protein